MYDNLGNRSTYTRDTTPTAYAANEVNEYTSIGGVSVYYDANGNLSRDEYDFEYTYDHENRLIGVSYEGAGSTQVAAFEYDSLGRMISSQLRFDTDADGQNETLKYYYDGQNAIAEYDPADNLSRRYVHGSTYVDERAVLIEGEADEADTFYYLLQELYSVAGLIARNGTVVEANVYEGYGPVATWGYRRFDFDRNTVINMTDITRAQNGMNGSAVETGDPGSDADLDGDTDIDDLYAVYATYNQTGNIDLHVSSVGNPFHFTGRRLHYLDDLTQAGANDNLQVQYNRARHYDPMHGRWLQRDPAGYVDGMSLYKYVKSQPINRADPFGLWSVLEHEGREKSVSKKLVNKLQYPQGGEGDGNLDWDLRPHRWLSTAMSVTYRYSWKTTTTAECATNTVKAEVRASTTYRWAGMFQYKERASAYASVTYECDESTGEWLLQDEDVGPTEAPAVNFAYAAVQIKPTPRRADDESYLTFEIDLITGAVSQHSVTVGGQISIGKIGKGSLQSAETSLQGVRIKDKTAATYTCKKCCERG